MISIVIPVKNGGEELQRLLAAIQRQETAEEVEIVVIDSGSTDGTPAVARAFGARVHAIAPGEFNHGATRNLGIELSGGETIVFTVDDAEPIGTSWLENLAAPLRDDPALAGTYSRQLPAEGAPAGQRYYLEFRYGPEPRRQQASEPAQLTSATTLFSNVSSAVRRSVLARHPFRRDLITAEDLEWCGRVLLAGYAVAYVPDSMVRHSHRFTLRSWFQRYFDQGMAAELTLYRGGHASRRAIRGEGVSFVKGEISALWRQGDARTIPRTLRFELVRYAGFRLGTHYRLVPRALRPRLSNTPTYWQPAEPPGASVKRR